MRRQARASNDYFSLSANGGVPRDRVLEVLQNPRLMARTLAAGRCMLCQAPEIDAAAFCTICRTFLNDEEREAARPYYEGY